MRCPENSLILITSKTKEIIKELWWNSTDPKPLSVSGVRVKRVLDFRFLEGPSSDSTSFGFLRILRRNNLKEKLLVSFYCCSVKSVLSCCMSA